MTTDELQTRFTAEIDHRGRDDKYIDGIEERELMQIGIQHGFDTATARQMLIRVCQDRGYVIEADVVQQIREGLRTAANGDGRLDRRGYERTVQSARTAVAGTTRTEADVRRLVLTTLTDNGTPSIRRGWFTDWHAAARRRAGLI